MHKVKRLLLSIFSLVLFFSVSAQVPGDTAALRNAINTKIVTNGAKQITALQVNQILNGMMNLTPHSLQNVIDFNSTIGHSSNILLNNTLTFSTGTNNGFVLSKNTSTLGLSYLSSYLYSSPVNFQTFITANNTSVSIGTVDTSMNLKNSIYFTNSQGAGIALNGPSRGTGGQFNISYNSSFSDVLDFYNEIGTKTASFSPTSTSKLGLSLSGQLILTDNSLPISGDSTTSKPLVIINSSGIVKSFSWYNLSQNLLSTGLFGSINLGGSNNSIQYNESNTLTGDNFFTYNGSQVSMNTIDSYGGVHILGRSGGEASFALQPDNISNGSAGQWIFYTNGSQLNNQNDFAMFNSSTGAPALILQASTNNAGFGLNNPQFRIHTTTLGINTVPTSDTTTIKPLGWNSSTKQVEGLANWPLSAKPNFMTVLGTASTRVTSTETNSFVNGIWNLDSLNLTLRHSTLIFDNSAYSADTIKTFQIIYPNNYNPSKHQGYFSSSVDQYNGANGIGVRANVVGNFWMYNSTGSGSIISGEASYRFAGESNFLAGGDTLFEFHLPEISTYGGTIIRPFSMYTSKNTGGTAYDLEAIANFTTTDVSGTPLFTFDNNGDYTFQGVNDGTQLTIQRNGSSGAKYQLHVEPTEIDHNSFGTLQTFDANILLSSSSGYALQIPEGDGFPFLGIYQFGSSASAIRGFFQDFTGDGGITNSIVNESTTGANQFFLTTNGGSYVSVDMSADGGASDIRMVRNSTLGGILVSTLPLYLQATTSYVYINGGVRFSNTAIADAGYTILITDYLIRYTSLTAARAVTLPSASTVTGQHFVIKDESGNAGSHSITIVGTVDGATNPTAISTNYGKYKFYSNGTSYFTE